MTNRQYRRRRVTAQSTWKSVASNAGQPSSLSPNTLACHSGAMCLRMYSEVPVLRMVVVKRVMNRHRVRMLRMRVTEVLPAAVTGVAVSTL